MASFPFKVESSEEFGRYLVATRDIQQWEVILKEKPIVFGPMDRDNNVITCLGCLAIIDNEHLYRCSKCKWPVCDATCEMMAEHADFECVVFSKENFEFSEDLVTSWVFTHIQALRSLLLKQLNPKKWNEILALQSHAETKLKTDVGVRKSLALTEFIQDKCKLTEFSQSEINHVLGVISTNSFEGESWRDEKQRIGAFLYTLASKAAHSCVPNCYRLIDEDNNFELRACLDIPEGTSLTTFYSDTWVPTQERQEDLRAYYHFTCGCHRCLDPTELGTYFSGIKCTEDNCSGYFVPANQGGLDVEYNEDDARELEFQCTQCQQKMSETNVEDFNLEFDTDVSNVDDEYNLKNLQDLNDVAKSYGKKVHANYFKLMDLEFDIAERIYDLMLTTKVIVDAVEEGAVGVEDLEKIAIPRIDQQKYFLNRLLTICQRQLDVLDVIRPGYTYFRGKVLQVLHYGMTVKLNEIDGEIGKPEPDNLEMEADRKRRRNEIEIVRLTAIKILSIEQGTTACQMVKTLEENVF